jgi:hypothetical protein
MKYLQVLPFIKTPPYHPDSTNVTAESSPSDTGQWSYDNDSNDDTWGSVVVGCLHSDLRGNIWTSY